MTKVELVEAVTKELTKKRNLSKAAVNDVVDSLFSNLGRTIKKETRFSYPGFGTWTVRKRKARAGRNPKTGEAIAIKASKTVGFRPAPSLKKAL